MKKRPEKLPKEYGWCGKAGHGVIMPREKSCYKCEREAKRKAEGKCCKELGHGPGHQSHTYCEAVGDHKVHFCTYGCYDQYASWKGNKKVTFTGYFDEAPEAQDNTD